MYIQKLCSPHSGSQKQADLLATDPDRKLGRRVDKITDRSMNQYELMQITTYLCTATVLMLTKV